MGYTKAVISGFSWRFVFKVITAVVTAGKIAILARLLTPTDTGVIATIAIALGVTEAATETGVNLTILQSKLSIKYFLNTAWVIAIARGFVIAIIMIALGFFLSAFMSQPQLLMLVALASLIPVVKGFINPAIVSFQKNLQFSYDSLYNVSLTIVNAALAILFVWLSPTIVALIWALIAGAVVEVVISFLFLRERPAFHYLPSRAKHIFANARLLSLSALLSYLNENIDDLIIGRLTGLHNLGLYHNAYALAHKPNYELTQAVHHGSLPIYSRIAHDPPRLRRAFWRSAGLSAVGIILVSLPLIFFPRLVIESLLGEKWLEAIPLVPWLTVAGVIQGLSMLGYSVLLGSQRFQWLNIHMFVTLVFLVSSLWWFTGLYGIMGSVMAVVAARALAFPLIVLGVARVLRTREHQ